MMKRLLALLLVLLCPVAGLCDLQAHFLDVGAADCCIIVCDGKAMIIDGGEPGDSSLVYSYLRNTLDVTHLECVVATHPHEDHIGGLPAALNACTVGRVFSPYEAYKSDNHEDLVKYAQEQGIAVEIPRQGYTFRLGGSTVEIHKPIYTYRNVNDMSLIVRITYGDTSFLFMGDAEKEREQDLIVETHLKSDLIKIGHHGSKTSTTSALLKAVEPEIAIISCGGNESEQPDIEVLTRLKTAGCSVYTTSDLGHIIVASDGSDITINCAQQENTIQNNTRTYVLNTNTKKYHLPDCSSVDRMKEKNKKTVDITETELERQGYEPCGICDP